MSTAGGNSFATATDLTGLDLTALTTDPTPVAGLAATYTFPNGRTAFNPAWWKFTVPAGGLTVPLDTQDSLPVGNNDRDTRMWIYQMPSGSSAESALVYFADNDDRPTANRDGTNNFTSLINLNLPDAGDVYYVVVSTFATDPSPLTDYRLRWGDGTPPPPPAVGEWTNPKRLSGPNPSSTSTNDDNGLVEGQMCVLDSGIVVVMAFSSASFAVHAWAVDISGTAPVVGPIAYFNSDGNSWASIPDDPKGMIIGDLGPMMATGDYTFAGMTGESESVDASGDRNGAVRDYGIICCLFSVDPTTLAITRDSIVTGRWDADDVPSTNNSMTRWGTDKVVITSADNFNPPKLWVVNPDGTHDTISLPLTQLCAGVAVSGDNAFFFSPPSGLGTTYHLYEVALPGGGFTDHGALTAVGINLYSWYGIPLSGGRVAYSNVNAGAGSDIGPFNLLVFDPALTGPYQVAPTARDVGWTGGYFSPAVSIDTTQDGLLLMGYYDGSVARWATVQEDGTVVDTGQVANFSATSTLWYNRLASSKGGGKVALFSGSGYPGGVFGVYLAYTVTASAGTISGVAGPSNVRFE